MQLNTILKLIPKVKNLFINHLILVIFLSSRWCLSLISFRVFLEFEQNLLTRSSNELDSSTLLVTGSTAEKVDLRNYL